MNQGELFGCRRCDDTGITNEGFLAWDKAGRPVYGILGVAFYCHCERGGTRMSLALAGH